MPTNPQPTQCVNNSNSSSSSGLRCNMSRAAGMFYFFIITLIFLGLLYVLKRWWHSSSISNGGGSIGSSSRNDKGNSNSRGRRGLRHDVSWAPGFLIFIYSGQLCCSTTHHPFYTPMPVLLDNVANLESMLMSCIIFCSDLTPTLLRCLRRFWSLSRCSDFSLTLLRHFWSLSQCSDLAPTLLRCLRRF